MSETTVIWMGPDILARLYDLLLQKEEVSAFLITDKRDPQHVIDVKLPPQQGSMADTVLLDDELPKFLDGLREEGLDWNQMRIWFHTHPAGVDRPSGMDEKTFREVFGQSDWAAMLILTKDYKWYGRVRTGGNVFPLSQEVDVRVGIHGFDFKAVNDEVRNAWRKEVEEALRPFPEPSQSRWMDQEVVHRDFPDDPDVLVVLTYANGDRRTIYRTGPSRYEKAAEKPSGATASPAAGTTAGQSTAGSSVFPPDDTAYQDDDMAYLFGGGHYV